MFPNLDVVEGEEKGWNNNVKIVSMHKEDDTLEWNEKDEEHR